MSPFFIRKRLLMKLDRNTIQASLKNHFPGKVIVKSQVTSTQEVAKQLHHVDTPVAILAEEQTNGHGKGQRNFYSPRESGLYLSVLLPDVKTSEMAKSGLFTTGLANQLATILERYFPGKQLGVKWVNDILLDRKKISGILVEAQAEGQQLSWIVGIGVNLSTKNFPSDIQQAVGSLSQDSSVNRNQLAADIINAVWQLRQDYQEGAFLAEYQRRLVLLGKQVTLQLANVQVTGIVKRVDHQGRLVIQSFDGTTHAFSDGEVVKVRY